MLQTTSKTYSYRTNNNTNIKMTSNTINDNNTAINTNNTIINTRGIKIKLFTNHTIKKSAKNKTNSQ